MLQIVQVKNISGAKIVIYPDVKTIVVLRTLLRYPRKPF
jgi:hypothetical protein